MTAELCKSSYWTASEAFEARRSGLSKTAPKPDTETAPGIEAASHRLINIETLVRLRR